ncbi:MAG TPA: hypothetical protein VJY34_24570, partial [Roseiarcus sp.]|nr:hypothetical protein [Roseiarcus sp.]
FASNSGPAATISTDVRLRQCDPLSQTHVQKVAQRRGLQRTRPGASLGGALAPGLTARSALEKFAGVQMIDVHLPTTDGREIVLTRYTQPEPELRLLISQLKLRLPTQPPPKITAAALAQTALRSEDLRA